MAADDEAERRGPIGGSDPPQNHAANEPILFRHVSTIDDNAITAPIVNDAFVSLIDKPIIPDRHWSNLSHPSSPRCRPHPRSGEAASRHRHQQPPDARHGSDRRSSQRRRAAFSSRANLAIDSDEANCFIVVGKAWIGQSRSSIACVACRCTTQSTAVPAIHHTSTAAAIIVFVATFAASHDAVPHQWSRLSPLPPSCPRNPCKPPPSLRPEHRQRRCGRGTITAVHADDRHRLH
ncbi:hypothetical protein ACLOJK_028614 [Asimina triloba]